MQSWKSFTANLPAVDMSSVRKGLGNTYQATREKLGNVGPDGITELPVEYRQLESRVDALKDVHQRLLKVTKVHETESYDYPNDIAESVNDLSNQAASAWATFANKNLKIQEIPPDTLLTTYPSSELPPTSEFYLQPQIKLKLQNTSLPIPVPAQPSQTPAQPKTLPHAISRAAKSGATELGGGDRLGTALGVYGNAMEKVGEARLSQDSIIAERFVTPWQATLSTSIGLAMKARGNVKTARLELDAARGALKAAAPAKQEQARLHVEEAEDKLVQNTETAIGLMKAVLENPEPLQNLSNLVRAQLIFHSTAAETLSGIQGEIEEAATAAEAEYRQSRGA